jgi:para-nitrobenzyl esterase
MYLMAAPPARGLFAKAIAQSNYMVSMPELKQARYGAPAAEAVGAYLGAKLGGKDLAGLRAMDAQAITRAAAAAGYAPLGVVDGKVLPRQPVETFERGEQAPVPLLAGFNAGEIRSLRMLAPPKPESAQAYLAAIRDRYGDLADAYLKLYPANGDLEESVIAATRDGLYGWTAERTVRDQTAIGQPAYLYLFDHGYPAADNAHLHAFHGSELPFMFGTTDRVPRLWPKPRPTDTGLSEAMVGYWASFARTGKPQAAGAPDWPAYDGTRAYMAFTDAPHPGVHVFPGMYELHEEAVCRRRAQGAAWNWNVGLISPRLTGTCAKAP